ncbi:hypothetical protein [Micromonospora lupini]|uniref:hypothetical protein n=1 Tax=Micromonospora lupini TaxID=285679 RepID=UPI000586513E|nr:hypothetical protein [Micromonospora lupini]
MTGIKGLTPAEYFVLVDSDGCAALPEILASWMDNGDRSPSIEEAVPDLARAIVSLARDGLVDVRRFELWPAGWDQGVRVTVEELKEASCQTSSWLPGARGRLLVIGITEIGGAWL